MRVYFKICMQEKYLRKLAVKQYWNSIAIIDVIDLKIESGDPGRMLGYHMGFSWRDLMEIWRSCILIVLKLKIEELRRRLYDIPRDSTLGGHTAFLYNLTYTL